MNGAFLEKSDSSYNVEELHPIFHDQF